MSTGVPIPTVKWKHNGTEITNSSRFLITIHGVLRILVIEPDDMGLYVCDASNEYHRTVGNVSLIVYGKEALYIMINKLLF